MVSLWKLTKDAFQEIFPPNPAQWPYSAGQKGLAAQIRKNRSVLENALFFDHLLADVGQIADGTPLPPTNTGAKLYPPKNREDLRRLHEKIEESETDSLKKTCFYYYILKDFKADSKFAMETAVPEQFCQLISGFYALDHLQFDVVPGYTDKILSTLLRHLEYPGSARLAVLFVESTRPMLDSTEKMSLYMDALIRTDLDAAFKYQLFTNLITAAMNVGPPRAELHRLVSFPFTTVEAEMFVEYLLGAAREDEFARDVLLMWNIQTARFTEARETMLGEGQGTEKRRVIREGLEKAKVNI